LLESEIFGLWPYHPECAPSHLISEAKQGQIWLVLGWKKVKYELDSEELVLGLK